MKYKVLKALVYEGKEYKVGDMVDILGKSISTSCLERKLIAEITEDKKVEEDGKTEDTETDSEKTAEEKTIEVENEEQKNANKSNKTGKNK